MSPSELANVYALADLLTEAGQLFTANQLHSVQIVYYPGRSSEFEFTDVKTRRYRITDVLEGKKSVLAYFKPSDLKMGLSEFNTDIRTQIRMLMPSGPDTIKAIRINLTFNQNRQVVSYKAEPGGFRFTKLQSSD